MGKFTFENTPVSGVKVITPALFGDKRGAFMETYNQNDFAEAGINTVFVQDNQSFSSKGVLRGLHFQKSHPQAKLVRVISGEAFDVAVDLRPDSPSFGRWYAEILSEENRKQLFIPEGFGHGFLALSETVGFAYKCSDFYRPDDEGGIIWNDPSINIHWPVNLADEIVLSVKDSLLPSFLSYFGAGNENDKL